MFELSSRFKSLAYVLSQDDASKPIIAAFAAQVIIVYDNLHCFLLMRCGQVLRLQAVNPGPLDYELTLLPTSKSLS